MIKNAFNGHDDLNIKTCKHDYELEELHYKTHELITWTYGQEKGIKIKLSGSL